MAVSQASGQDMSRPSECEFRGQAFSLVSRRSANLTKTPRLHKLAFASSSRYLRLADSVRLRKECFGGLAFDARTGTVLDIDSEAMDMLLTIRQNGMVCENDLINLYPNAGIESIEVIERLLELGMLDNIPTHLAEHNRIPFHKVSIHSSRKRSTPQHLISPEAVHWAITYKCNLHCPDCYVRRYQDDFPCELDTSDSLRVVDALADASVFQLAIGGGEPFARPDIDIIANYAHKRGLVVHVTTGYHSPPSDILERLSTSISSLQIGLKHERLIADQSREISQWVNCVSTSSRLGVSVGANLMLSNTVLAHFDRIVDMVEQAGFTRITLLRYKPPAELSTWMSENPSAEDMLRFEDTLDKTVAERPNITFRVDCALSFLMRHLDSEEALSHGIRGCVAGERILSLTPDGSAFPCSQLVDSGYNGGNILIDGLEAIWSHSKAMKKCRTFRNTARFRKSICGECSAKSICGDCRIFDNRSRSAGGFKYQDCICPVQAENE